MATSSSSPAVAKLLARYPDGVQALARDARALIERLLPGVEESVDPKVGLLAYGFGPGYKGMVCTLILSQKGVKLGLARGAELDDPHGLLAGAGKVHRHIAFKTAADLKRPGVTALIKVTYKAWQALNTKTRRTRGRTKKTF
jgi:hypothetical protein